MLTELTPEQEKLKQEYHKRGIEIGFCTDPADKPRAEKAISRIYELEKLKQPQFVWVASPFAAEEYINFCNGTKKYNGTNYWGQQDVYWIQYFKFCEQLPGVKYEDDKLEKLNLWRDIAESCCWIYLFENAAICCDRPEEAHYYMNERNVAVLHKDGGKAVKFRDGWGIYRLNGINVPEWVCLTPKEQITKEQITKETNADIRREIIRKVGNENLLKLLDYKVVHKLDDYELIVFDIGDGRERPFLKMINPSTGTTHIEGVPPTIKTVEEAICYRNGLETYVKPEVLK